MKITDDMKKAASNAYHGGPISPMVASLVGPEPWAEVIEAVAPLIIAAERARIEAKMRDEGLVVVPKQITDKMFWAWDEHDPIIPASDNFGDPIPYEEAYQASYRAMLAAAPAVKLWGEP